MLSYNNPWRDEKLSCGSSSWRHDLKILVNLWFSEARNPACKDSRLTILATARINLEAELLEERPNLVVKTHVNLWKQKSLAWAGKNSRKQSSPRRVSILMQNFLKTSQQIHVNLWKPKFCLPQCKYSGNSRKPMLSATLIFLGAEPSLFQFFCFCELHVQLVITKIACKYSVLRNNNPRRDAYQSWCRTSWR